MACNQLTSCRTFDYDLVSQRCRLFEGDSTNTSSCQCPLNTYWNGFVCALQLFENDPCEQSDACRLDLNLTCISPNCYGEFPKCSVPVFDSKHITFSYNLQ
jgi:hypothetical protein